MKYNKKKLLTNKNNVVYLFSKGKKMRNMIINIWLRVIGVNIDLYYNGLMSKKIFQSFNEPSFLGVFFRIFFFPFIIVFDFIYIKIKKYVKNKEKEKNLIYLNKRGRI